MNHHEGYGVAVVGCGVIGHTHVAALAEFPEFRVAALVDVVAANARAFADAIASRGNPRPAVYTRLSDALQDPSVDMVVVATSTGLHIPLGLEVLAAKKHLIVEKPLGVDLKRAQEIESAAAEAAADGIVASVISQRRFEPASQVVARALAQRRFGRVTSAVATVTWWRSQEYYDSADWRGTWAMDGGGALMNQGVHTVDLLLWFLGRPTTVHAHTALLAHEGIEVEDVAAATITFESGAVAALMATTAAYPGLTVRLQVSGTLGTAVIDGDDLVYFHTREESEAIKPTGLNGGGNQAQEYDISEPHRTLSVDDPIAYPEGHIRQYEDVLRAMQQGRRPGVTISDAVLALAAVRAVYVSATLHQSVLFDDVLAGRYNDLEVETPGRWRRNSGK